MASKKGIPKGIEVVIQHVAQVICGTEHCLSTIDYLLESLAPAIVELESSATARALAAAAEEVGELFDLMRRDGIPPGNPDKQHVIGLILALIPCEARLREEIRLLMAGIRGAEAYGDCRCDTWNLNHKCSFHKYVDNMKAELSTLQAELAGIEKK